MVNQIHAKKVLFNSFKWGKVMVLAFLLGTNLTMYATFLTAYFSEDKSVLVTINNYGEANLELWLMGFMTILSIFTIFIMLKEEKRKIHEA